MTPFLWICNTEKIKIILILIHTYSFIKNKVKWVAIDSRFISHSAVTRFHFLQTLPLTPIMAIGINFSIDTPWINQLSISLVVHQNMKHKIIIPNLTCEKMKHAKVKVVEES